jgi:hypothetical protein
MGGNGEQDARSEADPVVSGHQPRVQGWDWHELKSVAVFMARALLEGLWGLLTWSFHRKALAEIPDLHFMDTSMNRCLLIILCVALCCCKHARDSSMQL